MLPLLIVSLHLFDQQQAPAAARLRGGSAHAAHCTMIPCRARSFSASSWNRTRSAMMSWMRPTVCPGRGRPRQRRCDGQQRVRGRARGAAQVSNAEERRRVPRTRWPESWLPSGGGGTRVVHCVLRRWGAWERTHWDLHSVLQVEPHLVVLQNRDALLPKLCLKARDLRLRRGAPAEEGRSEMGRLQRARLAEAGRRSGRAQARRTRSAAVVCAASVSRRKRSAARASACGWRDESQCAGDGFRRKQGETETPGSRRRCQRR